MRRLALVAVLMLVCGLVYLQRATVLPLVEPYTGTIVDERGVLVGQKDWAVGTAVGWWESVAPWFAWKSVDAVKLESKRCRNQGRPDCDGILANPPADESLAGNASATTR